MGNLVTLPPALLSPPAPAPSEAPAEEGLSGGAPTTAAPAAQPVEKAPAPHESVARHILSALGGGDGPMGWAKSVLAGSLAAAGNAGGEGWLSGAGKAEIASEQLQRQKTLDAQAKQKQQFDQQMKQKEDARQEQELQIHMQDATVQRAMWNAQTAASVQTQQQNALRFPTLQKEDQLRAKQLSEQIQQSENDQLSVLSAAGVDIAKLEHVTSYDQLTEDHAKQAGSGGIFAVPNGEAHSDGEDKAGAYIVPGDVWDRPITKPISITTGYDVDPKTGKATPKTITAQEGTKVGTLLAIAKGAQTDLANKQGQIIQQANIAEKRAQTQKAQADTAKTQEETKQLSEGPEGAGKLLASGDLTLADLKSRGMTPQYIVKATEAAKALTGGKYNPSDEIVGESALKQAGNQTFYGSANSLLDKGGTLDQLDAQYKKLPNGKLPAVNKVKDWVTAASGSGATAGFAQTAIGLADDYAKVMGGGQGSDSAREEVLASFSRAHSPEGMKAAIDAARAAIKSQVSARIGQNRYLKQRVGYNLEDHEARVEHVPGGKAEGLIEGQTGTGSDGKKYMVKGGVWQPAQ